MKSAGIINHGCVVRILFYGLFLLGPFILTESHGIYVRSKNESLEIEDAVIRENVRNEYKRKVKILDVLGVSCFGVWFVWLMVLVSMKLIQRNNNRRRESEKLDE